MPLCMIVGNNMFKMYQKFSYLIYENIFFLGLVLLVLSVFFITMLNPQVAGDSISYVESINVLRHEDSYPDDFRANRIVTTYGALQTLRFFDIFVGDIPVTWLIINAFLYICTGLFFYRLVRDVSEDKKVALLSMILLVTNYAIIRFGLAYMMDIGGWFFYVISIYFSYKYLQEEKNQWLVISTLAVALGGLWKEYAFLAYVVIMGVIIYTQRLSKKKAVWLLGITGVCVMAPFILVNIYCYVKYDYTYFSWLDQQKGLYPGQNILVEYIKSFGSLYNFSWFFIVGGIVLYIKKIKNILVDKKIFFITLVALSALPVFMWPVVTRVLFVTAPALILISGFYIKEVQYKWFIVYPILILSAVCGYFMDSFILDFVNLPF